MAISVYSILSQGGFFILNKKLIKSTSLEAALLLSDLISKREYFRLNGDLEKTGGWFYNSQKNIELDTTLTPYQQRLMINLLKEKGYIDVKLMGLPAVNYYKINDEEIAKNLLEDDVKILIASSEKISQLEVKEFDINKTTSIKPQNNINILGNSKYSFEQFWDLYNKKVGDKKKCIAKWNKLTEEQKEKIMQTLPTFLATIKDKQFQPYPERYLNNERWNDDLSQQIKFDPTDPTKTKRVYN